MPSPEMEEDDFATAMPSPALNPSAKNGFSSALWAVVDN